MLGAIVGDVVGSVHESAGTKTKDFPLLVPRSTFTDDSVLTVAVADWLMGAGDLIDVLHRYTAAYPGAGFGSGFLRWALHRRREPYGSFGNGAAMRVSPVGFAFDTLDEVLDASRRSAMVTHDHPEGVRGAQATAVAVLLARKGFSKRQVRDEIEQRFDYDLGRSVDEIRPDYRFDITCQGTVPAAIVAFLDSLDFEDAIRNAISLGGDADTLACIAGGIAEAFYGGVPAHLADAVRARLDPPLVAVVDRFRRQVGLAD